jgi:hypothetical protein
MMYTFHNQPTPIWTKVLASICAVTLFVFYIWKMKGH